MRLVGADPPGVEGSNKMQTFLWPVCLVFERRLGRLSLGVVIKTTENKPKGWG